MYPIHIQVKFTADQFHTCRSGSCFSLFFLFLFSFPHPIGYIDLQRAMHYFCFIFCVLLIATYAGLSESTRQNTISDAQDGGNELEGMSIP